MQKDYTWLKDLKIGDRVFREVSNFGPNLLYPDEVIKLTKTQVVLKGTEMRYRRETGDMIGGGSWSHGSWIYPANAENQERYHKQVLCKNLSTVINSFHVRTDCYALSIEQLERLIPALTVIRDEIIPQQEAAKK